MTGFHHGHWPLLILFISLVFGVGTGCTQTRMVSADTPYAAINQQAKEHDVVVVHVDGHEAMGTNLRVTPDSTWWQDKAARTPLSVSTSAVAEIHIVNRERGVLQGFGVGALFGAALGAMAGGGSCQGDSFFTPGTCMLIGGGVLGGIGLLLGAGIGQIRGSRTVYRLQEIPPSE